MSRAAQLLRGAARAAVEDTAALSLLDVEVRGAAIVLCGQRARSYLLPAPFATMTALLPLLDSLSRYFGASRSGRPLRDPSRVDEASFVYSAAKVSRPLGTGCSAFVVACCVLWTVVGEVSSLSVLASFTSWALVKTF